MRLRIIVWAPIDYNNSLFVFKRWNGEDALQWLGFFQIAIEEAKQPHQE